MVLHSTRAFAWFSSLILAGSLLAGGAYAAGKQPFKMAVVPAAGVLPVYVAEQRGYFADEGLDFEMISINSGPGAATAVVSGSADMGYGGALPVIAARAQGIPFRFVLGGYVDQVGLYADTVMLAGAKSGVKSLADLKGKTIAVNNAGGLSDLQVRVKLQQAGIADTDVKILAIPFPQMPAALELGNADAVSTVAPFSTAIVTKGIGQIIAEGYVQEKDQDKPTPVAVFYAVDAWADKHPELIGKVKKAIDRANQFIKDEPAQAKHILKKQLRLPDDLLEAIVLPPYDSKLDRQGVQAVMDAAYLVKILARPMQAAEIMAGDAPATGAAE